MNVAKIESLGELKPHPEVPEGLISEPISVAFFDGKELRFTFDGDLENDESFLFDANQTVINFLRKNAGDRLRDSDFVYKIYRRIKDYYDSQSYDVVHLNLDDKTEIWKYIHPCEIYVCRGGKEDRNMYLQVHCECDWEEEHGLQLVFKNGLELTKASGIDYEPI